MASKPTKPFTVHFVCRGNTYRSRLAAAYMDTLVDERFIITSSGVGADTATVRTVEAYTKATAKAHHLKQGISGRNTQTTNELLAAADVIVFMNKDVYDEALRRFTVDTRKTLVWQVRDMDAGVKRQILETGSEQALLAAAAQTFRAIRRHCDELYVYLTHTSWVDVVDAANTATGLRLPLAWVTDRGLWHRGVHVVVQTADGKYVVGKRSPHIVFAPGMLEISLGGGVDSGELPLHAAQRETHEELGVQMQQKDFRPLFLYKHVAYHPHYKKQSKVHLYVYAVQLPVLGRQLVPQPEEVAELRALSKRQVKHLLNTHRVTNFGRLKWGYKLYQKAVAYSSLPL
jgi:protein-tyrosine-phosphatase/8-oxo-dGTP pyrophosphatase MutT (NUDIX family)